MFFASRMANRLLNWALESGSKSEKSALACPVAKACTHKLGEKSMPVPLFLDASRKDLKTVNPNSSQSDTKNLGLQSIQLAFAESENRRAHLRCTVRLVCC